MATEVGTEVSPGVINGGGGGAGKTVFFNLVGGYKDEYLYENALLNNFKKIYAFIGVCPQFLAQNP